MASDKVVMFTDDNFEAEVLKGHLSSCVPTGFRQGRNEKMIEELTDLFALARR